jgi:hypothetical protein
MSAVSHNSAIGYRELRPGGTNQTFRGYGRGKSTMFHSKPASNPVLMPACPHCLHPVEIEAVEIGAADERADVCHCQCGRCALRFSEVPPRDGWFVPRLSVCVEMTDARHR